GAASMHAPRVRSSRTPRQRRLPLEDVDNGPMRIFVSSSFEDLREHRAGAIRVLRQLGHEVLAMEDMIAGTAAPLPKVIEMVDRSEAYVGVFAWRYGYVPARAAGLPAPAPTNIP